MAALRVVPSGHRFMAWCSIVLGAWGWPAEGGRLWRRLGWGMVVDASPTRRVIQHLNSSTKIDQDFEKITLPQIRWPPTLLNRLASWWCDKLPSFPLCPACWSYMILIFMIFMILLKFCQHLLTKKLPLRRTLSLSSSHSQTNDH